MMHWIKEHIFAIGLLVLFIVAFGFFVFLTNSNTFADPDSFYHVKIAEDIAQGEDVREFPWLPYTVLDDYYTDQHYLYHVFLAPFVYFLGAFSGAKLATTLIASTLIVFFVYMLRKLGIRYPLLYGFLLLTIMPSMFRINLVKAPGFSIVLLLIGLLLAWKKNRTGAAIVAFIYVWSYGGFILYPAFVTLLVAMRLFSRWWQESTWLKSKDIVVKINWREFIKRFFSRKDVHVWLLVVFGTIVGVVANPFFPSNLSYLNDQLIQIGIVNYQSIIQVGGEWYPFAFMDLVAVTVVLSVLIVVAIVWGFVNIKNITLRTVFFFLLYLFFLGFTLKSRRYIEYYGPFGMIFVASAFTDLLPTVNVQKIWSNIKKRIRYTMLAAGIGVYVVIALSVVVPRDVVSVKNDFSGGFEYTESKDASLWAKEHIPDNEIIVHSSWDEFPYLLYWNDENRYIGGLDPTFSYKKNEERYWIWVNLTLGKLEEPVSEIMLREFDAQYLLVREGHDEMGKLIEQDGNYAVVFEGEDAVIYAHREALIL